jgi:alpha-mannosidase
MEYFSKIKLAWNRVNVFPHQSFHWQGIDGSTVLVHMPPEGDYNSTAQPKSLLKAWNRYSSRDLGKALLVYGAGDGGGGPDEAHLELLKRQRNLAGLPAVKDSSAEDFFEELRLSGVKDTWRGELYLETHQGTYTSQGRNKYYNRLCETLLHNVEALSAAALSTRKPVYPRADLDEIWRELLLYQFHDIIPGSSITRVNREAVAGYTAMAARLEEYIAGALALIGKDKAPVLVNLTSFARDEYLEKDGKWLHAVIPPYAAAEAEPAAAVAAGLSFTNDTLSNGKLTLRFGRSGEIASCKNAAGRELAARGLNHLILFTDKFTIPFNAWNIDPAYRRRPKKRLKPVSAMNKTDGPWLVRTVRYRTGKSSIEQKVMLREGSDTVRFETVVEWHEKHKMLRAEFFPADYADKVKCEIQFGHIVRSTTENNPVEKEQFEVCAHRWAAVENGGRGFAVLNNCKYGHRIKNGLISLALLRSTTFPDKEADRGTQRFTYAFCPFENGDLTKVIREASRLNNPPLLSDCGAFESIAETSSPQVIIETVKPAENGKGAVLRLYESLGKEAAVSLHTRIPHSAAFFADMLENPGEQADLSSLHFSPFEIKTVIVTR